MINEKQKWPTNKKKFDKEYLRIYGEKCPECHGIGLTEDLTGQYMCNKCFGVGYIEKAKGK